MKLELILALIVIFILFNYGRNENTPKEKNNFLEKSFLKRVIDGDTVELINGTILRLYGINTPEKGEYLSKEAVYFLSTYENKKIDLEILEKDKYNRTLAVIYDDGENINQKMVKNGFATVYMSNNIDFITSQEYAKNNEIGLWQKSKIACVKIQKIDPQKEYVVLKNECNNDLIAKNWSLKDAGRKKIIFNHSFCSNCALTIFSENGTNSSDELYWSIGEVWNNDGDMAFLRDENNLLIDHYYYE